MRRGGDLDYEVKKANRSVVGTVSQVPVKRNTDILLLRWYLEGYASRNIDSNRFQQRICLIAKVSM